MCWFIVAATTTPLVICYGRMIYVQIYDGIVSKSWNKLRLYLVRFLIIQAVPIACVGAFA